MSFQGTEVERGTSDDPSPDRVSYGPKEKQKPFSLTGREESSGVVGSPRDASLRTILRSVETEQWYRSLTTEF